MDKKEIIKTIPVFKGLNDKDYENLASIARLKKLEKNKAIFLEGETADGVYVLLKGKAKIYKISAEGKEQILRILGNKDFFGEVPVFQGKDYPAYAEVLEDSELLYFPAKDFIQAVLASPQFSLQMILFLSKRLEKFTQLIENISLKEVPTRLAHYFLSLSEKNECPNKCFLHISKAHLASIIGTVPETLSRVLKKMKEEKIIDVNANEILILDFEKLELLADSEMKL